MSFAWHHLLVNIIYCVELFPLELFSKNSSWLAPFRPLEVSSTQFSNHCIRRIIFAVRGHHVDEFSGLPHASLPVLDLIPVMTIISDRRQFRPEMDNCAI